MKQIITADQSGERADALLPRCISGLTRSAAQRLLETGAATVNGKRVKKSYLTAAGDRFLVEMPGPEPVLDLKPQNIPLDIVYEDGDVIVVNKPVGLVVHPAPGHPDGTSGLLIAAKHDRAHLSLAEQLQDHSLARVYEAIAVGGLREDQGTISAPIGRHPTDRKKMAVDRQRGRPAVTHYTVLARYPGFTHIECRLETGRTHQIRVHLASIGHPLLGDTVYGAKKPVPGLAGQCLHARRLRFRHPSTGALVELECPLPDYFVQKEMEIAKLQKI